MSRKMVLKKYGSIFIVCILLVGLLSGCGMREKDAKAYVTATLDASYKGKFKEYKKQTDATEKEVKNLYQENIEQWSGQYRCFRKDDREVPPAVSGHFKSRELQSAERRKNRRGVLGESKSETA